MQQQINPRKLLNSKWTSLTPDFKERHFMVVNAELNAKGKPVFCQIEAILTHKLFKIDWQQLKDGSQWRFGWH